MNLDVAAWVGRGKTINEDRESRALVMADWIARANIEHFKRLLEREADPKKRAVIETELAEEEQKLAALLKQNRKER